MKKNKKIKYETVEIAVTKDLPDVVTASGKPNSGFDGEVDEFWLFVNSWGEKD